MRFLGHAQILYLIRLPCDIMLVGTVWKAPDHLITAKGRYEPRYPFVDHLERGASLLLGVGVKFKLLIRPMLTPSGLGGERFP